MGKTPYKRGYKQKGKSGKQARISCSMCGTKTPRFKAFVSYKSGFKITDPLVLKKVEKGKIHSFSQKQYFCPKCARFRGIVRTSRKG